jgi:hypothetical protein
MRLIITMAAAAVAGVVSLLGVTGGAATQSACDALGGSVDQNQICHVHSQAAGSTVDFSFPTGYPDQQSVADYLLSLRDDFVHFAQLPVHSTSPSSLVAKPTTYQSGNPFWGTQSLVLEIRQDIAPRPVTWYKAFDYNLGARAPMTLDNLFTPGTKPLDVVFPAVRRELEKRWQPDVLTSMLGRPNDVTFANFALTDDAVIFFLGQGQLLGHSAGPVQVSVPKSEFGPLLAVG